mmetsp:Transcript_1972/g.2800  ORF Transcript_1972/g.2800 Transcript_1972/m.2800 type:complete len:521 (-) Transcript_1972:84-1646(-)
MAAQAPRASILLLFSCLWVPAESIRSLRAPISRYYKGALKRYRKQRMPKYVEFIPSQLKSETPGCLLVFLPGYRKDPQAYKPMCMEIQRRAEEKHNLRLHVGIGKFCNDMPIYLGTDEVNDIVDGIKKRASDAEVTYDKVFLCGHSAGAFAAFQEACKYDGFIQLGSTFNSKGSLRWPGRSLHSFPKPVLTVLGDRDGFVRNVALADELDDIDELEFKPSEVSKLKPVVTLPGINHMQMGDGIVSEYALQTGRRDIEPDVSLQEAWKRVGDVISEFISVNAPAGDTDTVRERAMESLSSRVENTKSSLEMYREMRSRKYVKNFVSEMQRAILNGKTNPRVVVVWNDDKKDFIYAKPFVETNGDLFVYVYPDKDLQVKVGTASQIVPTCSIKFKSQGGILKHKAYNGAVVNAPAPTAMELNEKIFNSVLEAVTPEQRERYLSQGKKIKFLPDKTTWKEGTDWVNAPLEVVRDKDNSNVVSIRSPVLHTLPDQKPDRFAGMTYMKFLMPAQAYEWIVFDAFK